MEWWSWLIVGIAIVGAAQAGAVIARVRKAPTQTPDELDLTLTDSARVEIGKSIAAGNLILATKQFRDATGCDLRTAHEAVQRWAKGVQG